MTRLLALIGAITLSAAALAQAPDHASGTWELNLSKSKLFPATHSPKRQTRTCEVKGEQETARHTGVDARGSPMLIEFTVVYDGKNYPLKGYADWDSIGCASQRSVRAVWVNGGPRQRADYGRKPNQNIAALKLSCPAVASSGRRFVHRLPGSGLAGEEASQDSER